MPLIPNVSADTEATKTTKSLPETVTPHESRLGLKNKVVTCNGRGETLAIIDRAHSATACLVSGPISWPKACRRTPLLHEP